MKRTIYLILLGLIIAASAAAQSSSIRIGTNLGPGIGPEFMVDGQRYNSTQVFVWPVGSKHVVQFLFSVNLVDDGTTITLPYQSSNGDLIRWSFGSWVATVNTTAGPDTGLLGSGGNAVQVVTASPAIISLIAQVTTTVRVHVQLFNSPAGGACGAGPDGATAANCFGIVTLNGQVFSSSGDLWIPAGNLTLNAFPFTGYVFVGWIVNGNPLPNPYLNTFNNLLGYNLTGPINLVPDFQPAKRVSFRTNPPQLSLLVDHVTISTPPAPPSSVLPPGNVGGGCTPDYTRIPVSPPAGIAQLCLGDFDFLPGSKHIIGAAVPQQDRSGVYWVFSKFSNGMLNNATYTTDTLLNQADVVTANFVPGARVSITSNPGGLKLSIDGRDNWPGYNFVWGQGETHTLSAAATQIDAKGRSYKFMGWSNKGNPSQTITIPDGTTDIAFAATYQLMPQVQLNSSPSGLTFTIDGQSCTTPCVVNRDPGSQMQVGAPASIVGNSSGIRYDFAGWTDASSAATRTVSFGQDFLSLTANYNLMVKLTTTSDPATASTFKLVPSSSDGYFAVNTQVSVTAVANPGFKLLHWDGDLTTTFSNGFVTMDVPRNATAHFFKVPFIAPAGIKNAAGDTPDGSVAPGSIIAIYGDSLTDSYVVGRSNPLAQAIGDVTVTVAGRLLPLLFVSPQQINAQVPSGLDDGTYTLTVSWVGHPDVNGTFTISRDAPGVYTRPNEQNAPLVLAVHDDGTAVTPDSPARRNETISIYGTGFGPYDHPVIDGFFISPTDTFNVMDPVVVKAGDGQYTPVFAGAVAGMVGTTVVQLKITNDIPSGATLDMVVNVNGKDSNKVQLPVQ